MSDPIGSATGYERLRRDVGATFDLLDDLAAESYFVEADERYPDDSAKMTAYTRVIALRGLLADSAKLGRYAQNQSEEDYRTVFANVQKLLAYWEGQVALAADPPASDEAAAFFFTRAPGRRGL